MKSLLKRFLCYHVVSAAPLALRIVQQQLQRRRRRGLEHTLQYHGAGGRQAQQPIETLRWQRLLAIIVSKGNEGDYLSLSLR